MCWNTLQIQFKKLSSSAFLPGALLIFAAILALILANSPIAGHYHTFLHETKGIIGIGAFKLEKYVIHWINDGLMAIFFFTIGLEVKRELTSGFLKTWSQRTLPLIAAMGGMFGPALVYLFVIGNGPEALKAGWAIPAATDIAFALGVFALIAKGLPPSLRAFLLSLAIFDDIGAIIIIALFYTQSLGIIQLLGALTCLLCLIGMNALHIHKTHYYVLIGFIMWAFVLKSGVHATLAGVALAFTIPNTGQDATPTKRLEHELHNFVVFFILPLFAFANAGVSLEGITPQTVLNPLTLAVALGLLVGKQAGILGSIWLATRFKSIKKPRGASWGYLWGITCLAGIGFTMSFFISSLAFTEEMVNYHTNAKLGILIGSLISAILGLIVLMQCKSKIFARKKSV